MLSFTTTQVGDTHVLELHGHLDALTVPDIRPEIEAMLARGNVKIVVDLSGVDAIDSTGVALVVSLFKRLRAIGGGVRIVGVNGQPREIFQYLRLDRSLPMADSVDEALAGW